MKVLIERTIDPSGKPFDVTDVETVLQPSQKVTTSIWLDQFPTGTDVMQKRARSTYTVFVTGEAFGLDAETVVAIHYNKRRRQLLFQAHLTRGRNKPAGPPYRFIELDGTKDELFVVDGWPAEV